MHDSNVMNMSAQIECARDFDQKLLEIRRKVCEPSRLGGGGGAKTRAAIETIKSEAESLLEYVTKLSEDLKSDNAVREKSMSDIQNWMDDVSGQIEPLEASGREAGLIRSPDSVEENVNLDAIFENGLEKKLRRSDGRKSSISRRLFESVILTPAASSSG